MNPRILVVLGALFVFSEAFSQKQVSQWYFGRKAALDFLTSPPTVLQNSSMIAWEGCSSISDTAGNLLFYTSGDTVWNKLDQPMANGTGLAGHKSAAQTLIVPQPGATSLYYVFTPDNASWQSNGLSYSVVDLSLAGGNGSVTVKNQHLFPLSNIKIVKCKVMHRPTVFKVAKACGSSL